MLGLGVQPEQEPGYEGRDPVQEGTGRPPKPASFLGWHVSRGAQGELVRLVNQAWRGQHMFLSCCHHGNGSSCRICVQGRGEAITWSNSSKPGVTRDPLTPSPWAGQRNEI